MKGNTKKLTMSAITAALIFVVTWSVRIPVPATAGGYVNFGDVIIYISAYLLGGPAAGAAAAVGSALADTAGGAAAYIPATFFIKGFMGLLAGLLTAKKKNFLSYAIASTASGAMMIVGYGLYELILFGFPYAAAAFPFNLIQWAGSLMITLALFPVSKRLLKIIA
jgi:uncharacterized membrane protein